MIMISLPKYLTLGGQQFIYNENNHTVILEITEPFNQAGRLLSWEPQFGMKGLGVNKEIISFVQKTKSKLLIRILSEASKNSYWINYDKLRDTIKNHTTEYSVSGKTLNVIPWMLFSLLPGVAN
ncbi:MAG: hypothetical protein GKS07_07790 [Nitrosopumilus sp.]|nr:MAG: hypothetical protein GKS07_07790 [Nitrosopumilus sp.]